MPLLLRAVAILALLAGVAGVAGAQPTPEQKAEAKQAFERAEAAERRKDWRRAIDEYQRAYELLPHPDVLFNIAVDFERLEEYRDAATYYRRYLDEKPDAADRARVAALIDKLRARPGRVTITSDPPGARVRVDGRDAGVTPVELELAGAHRLELARDGAVVRRDLLVEFGEPVELAITLAAKPGVLVVHSNVEGARVTIDGVDAGVTPLRIEVPAGPHRVVVAAEGWATHERAVDVPPEGSTQVTANLVRPLGYTPPATERPDPRGYVVFGGGADVGGELGGIYQLLAGTHRGRFGFGLGYAFAGDGAAFLLEARVDVTRTRVRPYVRAVTGFGATTTLSGHVGVAGSLDLGTRGRTSVFVELGMGLARSSATADEDAAAIVPLLGGVQLSY